MALQKHDELNRIAIPYEKYFGEMGLSEEEIKRRISLADAIEDVLIMLFTMIAADIALRNVVNGSYYRDYLIRQYEDALIALGFDFEQYPALQTHIMQTADEVIKQNIEKPEEKWNTSQDRAMAIAENEANAIGEYAVFQDAVDSGKTSKTWHTMIDKKVRHTHEELESLTIPIMARFQVGAYEMYQPKDTSLGAGMEETANCRCWCTYL